MHGMSMGGAGAGSQGIAAGGQAALNLLPDWVGALGATVFLLVAGAHLAHLAMSAGERRPWHLCHVAAAIGMASMYAPATIDPLPISAELWQLLFCAATLAAALRWLSGGAGLAAGSALWLLTAIELGAMAYMWSPSLVPSVSWALVAYLAVEASLWLANGYRVLDGGSPLIRWGALAPAGDGVLVSGASGEALVGDLDISVSMTAMAVGMGYMLVAMQLMA